jgi:hypothetical protein
MKLQTPACIFVHYAALAQGLIALCWISQLGTA